MTRQLVDDLLRYKRLDGVEEALSALLGTLLDGDRQAIDTPSLMEGVEDIPGTALAEGMTWNWETFPEYLDELERLPRTVDHPRDPQRAERVIEIPERQQHARFERFQHPTRSCGVGGGGK